MRRSVVSGEAAAIHAEDNGQVLQSNVVDDRVKRALQEGGVNSAEGPVSLGRHPRREDDGVLFRYADIEVTLRVQGAEEIQSRTVGHGCSDGNDLVIRGGELGKGLREDLGVGFLSGSGSFTGLRIVGPEAVKLLLLIERGLEATALLRDRMQDNGLILLLEKFEGVDQKREVVAVDGAVVAQTKLFKEHRGPEKAFHGLFRFAGDV